MAVSKRRSRVTVLNAVRSVGRRKRGEEVGRTYMSVGDAMPWNPK